MKFVWYCCWNAQIYKQFFCHAQSLSNWLSPLAGRVCLTFDPERHGHFEGKLPLAPAPSILRVWRRAALGRRNIEFTCHGWSFPQKGRYPLIMEHPIYQNECCFFYSNSYFQLFLTVSTSLKICMLIWKSCTRITPRIVIVNKKG